MPIAADSHTGDNCFGHHGTAGDPMSRNAEVKQICALNQQTKATPNSMANPSFGWFSAVQIAHATIAKRPAYPGGNGGVPAPVFASVVKLH
jgi:hypothetical protein